MESATNLPLKKLTKEFYDANEGLIQALDGGWSDSAKVRGYGIVVVSINSLTFGIPLRTHIKHKQSFFTDVTQDHTCETRKGLDFSKAVLISENSYIDSSSFKIPSEQFDRIQDNHEHIVEKFTKYIKRYIKAVNRNDRNVLPFYTFSTLQNYHVELGLSQ